MCEISYGGCLIRFYNLKMKAVRVNLTKICLQGREDRYLRYPYEVDEYMNNIIVISSLTATVAGNDI